MSPAHALQYNGGMIDTTGSLSSRYGDDLVSRDGEGDDLRFCATCAFAPVCLSEGYSKAEVEELHCLIEHTEPYHRGQHIFREGDPFEAVMAVRAGTVKTYLVDDGGREQILGFFLPGELIGLGAIHEDRYPCNAVALDTVTLCRFSFPAMATLAQRMPGVQEQLFRLLSRDIGKAAQLAGDFTADERMSAFLVELADRFADRGYSPTRFMLSMSRGDIASYLRLAPETVSRVLKRFQHERLIEVKRRDVTLLDKDRLRHMARSILRP